MKYILRTTSEGVPLPVDRIRDKRKEVIASIIASGHNYLEYEAVLGSVDIQGDRIEESVKVIEDVSRSGERYV